MFLLFQSYKPGSTTEDSEDSDPPAWDAMWPHIRAGDPLYKKGGPRGILGVLHTVLLRSGWPERALKQLLKHSVKIENGFSVCNIHLESKTFTYTVPWVARIHSSGSQVIRTRGILLPIPSTSSGLADLDVLIPPKRHTSAKGHTQKSHCSIT